MLYGTFSLRRYDPDSMEMMFPHDEGSRGTARAMPLDYATLVAGVASNQGASRTAAVAARIAVTRRRGAAPASALATLILGEREWPAAAAMLAGSFHPDVAERTIGKARSTNMTGTFTFAF